MRYLLRDLITWAFKHVITILPLKPGDVLIVYDSYIAHQLSQPYNGYPLNFKIPIIDGSCNPGEEHEILKKLSFEEFNKVWNMAYHSYAEAQWNQSQDRYYLRPPHPQKPPQPSPLLRRFLLKLENVKLKLAEKVGGLGRKRNGRPLEPTLSRPGLIAGRGEKQLRELVRKQSKPL